MQVNVNFRNIEARRFSNVGNSVNINNNSTLVTVSGVDDKLSVSFVFSSNYEPNVGVIRIEGELLMEESKDNVKRALTEWEKSGGKNLPKDIAEKIHNTILSNCMVEATILSREIRLPAPIPTPHVSIDPKNTESAVSDEEVQHYIR